MSDDGSQELDYGLQFIVAPYGLGVMTNYEGRTNYCDYLNSHNYVDGYPSYNSAGNEFWSNASSYPTYPTIYFSFYIDDSYSYFFYEGYNNNWPVGPDSLDG